MSWEGRVYAEFTMSLLLGGSSIIYFLKKGFFKELSEKYAFMGNTVDSTYGDYIY